MQTLKFYYCIVVINSLLEAVLFGGQAAHHKELCVQTKYLIDGKNLISVGGCQTCIGLQKYMALNSTFI